MNLHEMEAILWKLIVLLLIKGAMGWNFSSLNTTNEDVTVLHVSTYYMRVFLSIKSDSTSKISEWKIIHFRI